MAASANNSPLTSAALPWTTKLSHSAGSVEMAARHPARVRSLVLSSTPFTDEPFLVGPTTYTTDCHIPLGRPMALVQIYKDLKLEGTP